MHMTITHLASLQSTSDATFRTVGTILTTLETLAKSIQEQTLALLDLNTLDVSTRQSLTALVSQLDAMLNGADRDGDGHIDPVPGEAAAAQFYIAMQQVGAIRLFS